MHVNIENKWGEMVLAPISTSSHYQVLIIKSLAVTKKNWVSQLLSVVLFVFRK